MIQAIIIAVIVIGVIANCILTSNLFKTLLIQKNEIREFRKEMDLDLREICTGILDKLKKLENVITKVDTDAEMHRIFNAINEVRTMICADMHHPNDNDIDVKCEHFDFDKDCGQIPYENITQDDMVRVPMEDCGPKMSCPSTSEEYQKERYNDGSKSKSKKNSHKKK